MNAKIHHINDEDREFLAELVETAHTNRPGTQNLDWLLFLLANPLNTLCVIADASAWEDYYNSRHRKDPAPSAWNQTQLPKLTKDQIDQFIRRDIQHLRESLPKLNRADLETLRDAMLPLTGNPRYKARLTLLHQLLGSAG